MKLIYRADDGTEFDSKVECAAHEKTLEDDLARRHREDFDFMVMCAYKGNMGMYELLRDRSLPNKYGTKP